MRPRPGQIRGDAVGLDQRAGDLDRFASPGRILGLVIAAGQPLLDAHGGIGTEPEVHQRRHARDDEDHRKTIGYEESLHQITRESF